jgi:drug/metabolite transporter (DMT)-like permease
MKHRLKLSQYAILLTVMLTASVGDTLLARGMSQVGPVDLHHLGLLFHALSNPNVVAGIVLLIGFFASYMTALSWADLTFVMPATAFGYVVVALLSRFWLHEHLSLYRWAGIALIVCAVGFVAGGPSRTEHPSDHHELDLMDSGAGR